MISEIERIAQYLFDITHSLEKISDFLKDTSAEAFVQDEMRQDAVHMRLLIIGEAVNNIQQKAPSLLERHPEIPWRLIRGMRNKIAHEYFNINPLRTWCTAKEDLPILKAAIEQIKNSEPELAEALAEIEEANQQG